MNNDISTILKDLTTIFRDVLESDKIVLTELTTANEIADWDSVNHLILLHAIEEHYKIKFELGEIINFRSVGDICLSISNKPL